MNTYVCNLIFLIVATISLSCSNQKKVEEIEEKPPNIIFIMLDDIGKEWISSYGAQDIKTPNIDELARTGMRFENAYSMPQCTPTRITLLTGQYPSTHGWVNHYDVPRLGHGGRFDPILNPSFARMIRDAGYATCAAGKWQINDFRLEPEAMVNAGFDAYCMWTGGENGGSSTEASQMRYWDPYIHTKEGSKSYKGEFGEDIFTDFIIDFMKENKDDPMMIYYPMCLPHGPLTTTPTEKDAPKEEQHKAMVRYTDIILKRITDALDELKIRDNTIIVWTTDNGTGVGQIGRRNNHYVRGGKMHLTENGLNAPFIVNCPGKVPAGVVTEALMDFTDLLPTFCDLAGAPLDEKFKYDGHSFAPLILGETKDSERDWIMGFGGRFAMLVDDKITSVHTFRDRVIRDKSYKAYIDTIGQIYEIIDFKTDLDEQINLIDSKELAVQEAYHKFQDILNQLPKKDNSPIYKKLDTSYYDHPASALNKIALGGKKGAAKSLPVTEEEYIEKTQKK